MGETPETVMTTGAHAVLKKWKAFGKQSNEGRQFWNWKYGSNDKKNPFFQVCSQIL